LFRFCRRSSTARKSRRRPGGHQGASRPKRRRLTARPARKLTEDSPPYEPQVSRDSVEKYSDRAPRATRNTQGGAGQCERALSVRQHPRRAAARRGRSAVAEYLHCSGPVTGRKRHGPNPCDRPLCRFTPSFEQLVTHVRSTRQTIEGDAREAETRKLLTSRRSRRCANRISTITRERALKRPPDRRSCRTPCVAGLAPNSLSCGRPGAAARGTARVTGDFCMP
jgi:hypothetical protein